MLNLVPVVGVMGEQFKPLCDHSGFSFFEGAEAPDVNHLVVVLHSRLVLTQPRDIGDALNARRAVGVRALPVFHVPFAGRHPQMLRVDALPIPADVVNVHPFRDWADQVFVDVTVGSNLTPTTSGTAVFENPVALVVCLAHPVNTSV
jgi:hypothetical protein